MKRYFEFVPTRFESRVSFLHNINQKIDTAGPQLGLTPAEVTEFKDHLQFCIDTTNNVNVKRKDLDEAIEARNLLDENEMKEIRRVIARMRKSPLFTTALGAQLGILASAVTIDTTEVKPLLKLKVVAGQIHIAFRKQGIPSICIFSRQRGTTNWEKIAQVNHSPFLDSRSLAQAGKPEAREYMALFHDGRTQVGQESEIYSILTGTQASELL
jgi:hypothetical protein